MLGEEGGGRAWCGCTRVVSLTWGQVTEAGIGELPIFLFFLSL